MPGSRFSLERLKLKKHPRIADDDHEEEEHEDTGREAELPVSAREGTSTFFPTTPQEEHEDPDQGVAPPAPARARAPARSSRRHFARAPARSSRHHLGVRSHPQRNPTTCDPHGAPRDYVTRRASASTSLARRHWLQSTRVASHPARRVSTRTTWRPQPTLLTSYERRADIAPSQKRR